MEQVRHLILVLGDQCDPAAAAFDGADAHRDLVWMAEASDESTHVWSAQQRIAYFLSAMRHHAAALRTAGYQMRYHALDDQPGPTSLAGLLAADLRVLRPERIILTEPGDWRVLQALVATAAEAGIPLDVRTDRHFLSTIADFAAHAHGRKALRMEYFYREMRQRHQVLMDGGSPAGGHWNFDAENRESFPADGPGPIPAPRRVPPDAITTEVIALVRRRFADHPGQLDTFAWPVTRTEALACLDDFIRHRLPLFGRFQDALWSGEPWLWHAHIAAAMNLKLLHPREIIVAAEAAWRAGHAPLASTEGFIRQILGWREYVRGIYWTRMPAYAAGNALEADADLPAWYWTGDTPMACLSDTIRQTLRTGYAHHIQRLMVTGLYALLLGVRPQAVHAWYLAVYVDAVEWVELPNTLGMSQAADGGLMASKPYIASGAYIQRMGSGSHCARCPFQPTQRTGPTACPFTTLYWDFLIRHEARFAKHPRMVMQVRNLARLSANERAAIQARAAAVRGWR
jgi:deoxyribodipyrimidine photolyase-related protein